MSDSEHPKTFEEILDSVLLTAIPPYIQRVENPDGDGEDYDTNVSKRAVAKAALIQAHKEAEAYARDEGELIGAAKVLDVLWDGSYYRCGYATSEVLKREMVYLFGEDWSVTMYDFMLHDGRSKPSCHPSPVRTLEELRHSTNHMQEGGK